jgi:hypothetical protein
LDTLVWIDRQSGYLLPIFTILSILLAWKFNDKNLKYSKNKA